MLHIVGQLIHPGLLGLPVCLALGEDIGEPLLLGIEGILNGLELLGLPSMNVTGNFLNPSLAALDLPGAHVCRHLLDPCFIQLLHCLNLKARGVAQVQQLLLSGGSLHGCEGGDSTYNLMLEHVTEITYPRIVLRLRYHTRWLVRFGTQRANNARCEKLGLA